MPPLITVADEELTRRHPVIMMASHFLRICTDLVLAQNLSNPVRGIGNSRFTGIRQADNGGRVQDRTSGIPVLAAAQGLINTLSVVCRRLENRLLFFLGHARLEPRTERLLLFLVETADIDPHHAWSGMRTNPHQSDGTRHQDGQEARDKQSDKVEIHAAPLRSMMVSIASVTGMP
jgi:hypothetical protein